MNIGPYTVKRRLTNEVYFAEREGIPFVLKRQDHEQTNEMRALRTVSHPNIMRLEGVFSERSVRYAVLEYVPGDDLWRHRGAGAVFARSVLLPVARAVAHLHERRWVFNDVSPNNILALRDLVKLIDLGECMPYAARKKTVGRGTIGFRSLQLMHGESRPENDLFALGALTYFLEHGNSPSEPGGADESIAAIIEEELLRDGPPRVCSSDPGLDRLVRGLLDPVPEARPRIDEIEAALE